MPFKISAALKNRALFKTVFPFFEKYPNGHNCTHFCLKLTFANIYLAAINVLGLHAGKQLNTRKDTVGVLAIFFELPENYLINAEISVQGKKKARLCVIFC